MLELAHYNTQNAQFSTKNYNTRGEKKYDSCIGKKLINYPQESPDSGLIRQKLQINFKYAERANENHGERPKETMGTIPKRDYQ